MFPPPQTGAGYGFGANAPGGAASAAQRELRYKVTVVGDTTHAQQQFQQLAASAQNANSAAQQFIQTGPNSYGYGTPTGQTGNNGQPTFWNQTGMNQWQQTQPWQPAAAKAPPGVMSQVGNLDLSKGLGMLAGVVATATVALTIFNNTLRTISDGGLQSLSARAKHTGAIDRVPLVGGLINSAYTTVLDQAETYSNTGGGYGSPGKKTGFGVIGDAINSAADVFFGSGGEAARGRFNAARDDIAWHPYSSAVQAGGRQRLRSLSDLTYQSRLGMAEAEASYLSGSYSASNTYLRDSGMTGFEAENERLRQGARVGEYGARAAVGPANVADYLGRQRAAAAGIDRDQTGILSSQAVGAARGSADLARNDPSVRVRVIQEALSAQRALRAEAEALDRLEKLSGDRKEAAVALAKQEAEARRALVGLTQAELAVIERKIQKVNDTGDRVRGAAVNWAMTGNDQKEMIAAAARTAQTQGWDSLTPEMRSALMGSPLTNEIGADAARRSVIGKDPMFADLLKQNEAMRRANERRAGENDDPALAALLRMIGADDKNALNAQRLNLQAKVELELKLNEQALRDSIEKALQGDKAIQVVIIDARAKVGKNQAEIEKILGDVQRGQ